MKHVLLARAYICIYTGTTLYTTWCEQRPSVLNKRIAVTRYIIILWKSPLQSYVIQLYVLAILFIYHCYFLTKSQNRRSATLVCVRGWKWRSANTWRWKIHWSSTILPQKTIPNLPTTFSFFDNVFMVYFLATEYVFLALMKWQNLILMSKTNVSLNLYISFVVFCWFNVSMTS